MALAFIAFFGVLTAAVLRYADATDLQKAHIEKSALRDSLAEGGAAWAAADAADANLPCAGGGYSSLSMQGGAVVSYTIKRCHPGPPPGTYCSLCLLGDPSPQPQTPLLNTYDAPLPQLTVNGEIDINGSVYGRQPIRSVGLNQGISLLDICNAINTTHCSSYPTGTSPPPASLSSPFADPLAGWLRANPPPTGGPVHPAADISHPGITMLSHGVYPSIKVSNHAIAQLSAGVYIITGTIDIDDASLIGSGAVLYLACPTAPYACAAPGQPGGAIKTHNNGSVTLVPPLSPDQYAGVSLFADPYLADPMPTPRNWASCAISTSCPAIFFDSNNVESFGGTVYMHSGSIYVTNRGTLSVGGRLIARAMTGVDSVNLKLLGPGPVPCPVFDDSVAGASGPSSSTGRAIVQAGCNGRYGIVDFNYFP
jgi:hypothetical protein